MQQRQIRNMSVFLPFNFSQYSIVLGCVLPVWSVCYLVALIVFFLFVLFFVFFASVFNFCFRFYLFVCVLDLFYYLSFCLNFSSSVLNFVFLFSNF